MSPNSPMDDKSNDSPQLADNANLRSRLAHRSFAYQESYKHTAAGIIIQSSRPHLRSLRKYRSDRRVVVMINIKSMATPMVAISPVPRSPSGA